MSQRSGSSNKVVKDFIHGNLDSRDVSKFKKKMNEAKSIESKINMYEDTRIQPDAIRHLSIPDTMNMAFPNNIMIIPKPPKPSKTKLSYAQNDYQKAKDAEKSRNL